jgi:hypothetical protein
MTKQSISIQKGDIIRLKKKDIVCRCESIDTYGDVVYILGSGIHAKGGQKYYRYPESEWEKVENKMKEKA